jgi:8-oxo-dGTP pyrophosphatase MutT (NUDIX family)
LLLPASVFHLHHAHVATFTAGCPQRPGEFSRGRFEEGDANLEATALREAYEELGIDPHSIEILGEMSSIYIPVSNSLVHPFLSISERQPAFKPNPLEVKEIIETELRSILDPLARGIALFPGIGNSTIEAPYYKIGQYQVWGATAMILSEMEAIIA